MPAVSVIIPVYNVEKDLRDGLDSVCAQTLKDIEIICVDDGSTDNSSKILDEYAAKDSRVKVIHQENKGTHFARKAGVLASTGEYITFLDPDDKFTPDACERAYKAIRKKNVDILQFGMKTFSDDAPIPDQVVETYRKQVQNCGYLSSSKMIFETVFTEEPRSWALWGKVFTGSVIRQANLETADRRILMCEDAYVFMLAAWFAESMDYMDDELYLYRIGDGISTTESAKKYLRLSEDLQIIPLLRTFAEKQRSAHDTSALTQAIENQVEHELKACLSGLCFSVEKPELKQQLLSYCIQYVPAETAHELASLLTKQKEQLDKAYRDIDDLQDRFDELSKTKAVRFAGFIRRLLHRGNVK